MPSYSASKNVVNLLSLIKFDSVSKFFLLYKWMLLFDINVNGLLNEKDRNQRDKQNFLALGDLVISSNKVFIE